MLRPRECTKELADFCKSGHVWLGTVPWLPLLALCCTPSPSPEVELELSLHWQLQFPLPKSAGVILAYISIIDKITTKLQDNFIMPNYDEL
jgi:hypothetical protein